MEGNLVLVKAMVSDFRLWKTNCSVAGIVPLTVVHG